MASSKIVPMSKLSGELFALAQAFGDEGRKAMVDAARLGKKAAVVAIGTVKGDFKAPPIDTGEMRRSYVVSKTTEGATLENVAPHAAFMEFGTRPHFVPIQPLLEWARRKLRVKPPKKKKKKLKASKPKAKSPKAKSPKAKRPETAEALAKKARAAEDQEAQAKKLAYGTRKLIAAEGTAARGYHAMASEQFPDLVEDALLKRLRRIK